MKKEWIEIRDWPGHELERANMLEAVYYLYNSDKPCEFVVANTELEGEEESGEGGEKGVRYFLGLPEESKDVIMERLEGEKFDVREGPNRKPPSSSDYGVEAELEAKRHYGVPFLAGITRSYGKDSFDDHPDIPGSLVSALSSGGAVRMTFSRSDRAKRGARKRARTLGERARRTENGGYSPGQELTMGKTHDGLARGSQRQRTVRDQTMEEKAERWKDRADSGMFACDVHVYGGSRRQVERLAAIFPFRPNSLRVNWTEAEDEKKGGPEPEPEVPLPHRFRKYLPLAPVAAALAALAWLSGSLGGVLAALSEITGGFPRSLLTPEGFLLLSGLAGTAIWGAKDALERNHIAFSIPELSLVVSIPERLARFGEKGQEPASRFQSSPLEGQLGREGMIPEGPSESPPPEVEKEKEPEEPREEAPPSEQPTSDEEELQESHGGQSTRPMPAPAGEPTRIEGILSDLSAERVLSNVGYEILMDGEPYDSGETDEDGSYSFVFTPPDQGIHTLSVKPRECPEASEEIKIDSRPTATSESKGEASSEREAPEKEKQTQAEAGRERRFDGPPPAAEYEVNGEGGGET